MKYLYRFGSYVKVAINFRYFVSSFMPRHYPFHYPLMPFL